MNIWIQTRIQELKIWLKVSTAMCLLTILGAGVVHLYHGYEVNVQGKMIFWANPDVETQIAMLPEAPPTPAKKVQK